MSMINKEDFLTWIASEKAKIVENIENKGKKLSSSNTPREYERVKILDAVKATLDEFEAVNPIAHAKEKYRNKIDDFYANGDGRGAMELAKKLRSEGLSYQAIANELQLAGFKTVNGRTEWSPARLRSTMLKLEEKI